MWGFEEDLLAKKNGAIGSPEQSSASWPAMKLCRAQAGVWGNVHNIPLNFLPSKDGILAEAMDCDARASVDVEGINGLG